MKKQIGQTIFNIQKGSGGRKAGPLAETSRRSDGGRSTGSRPPHPPKG